MSNAKENISQDAVLQLIAELFSEAPENIVLEATRETLLGWDSMGTLLLMAELDERFGVSLDDAGLNNMQTIADIIDFMRQQGIITE